MYCVYMLTWPRSSLIYVGRTSNIVKRLESHVQTTKHLGLGKPCMEILEHNLTEVQAYTAEQKWIQFLNSTTEGVGLNKTYGGQLGREIRVLSKKDHKVRTAPPSKRKKS